MPTYLWTGKDRYGNPTVQRISAPTVEQAKAVLVECGHTDLQLQLEDVTDTLRQKHPNAPVISAEDQLRFLRAGSITAREVLQKSFMRSKGTIFLFGLLLAWSIYRGNVWTIVLSAAGILFVPFVHFWFAQAGLYYSKLVKAGVWYRWEEVLACVERLKRAKRRTKLAVGDAGFCFHQAQALAGLGRFDEALAELARSFGAPGMPRWRHLALQAAICDIAKRTDQALECSEQAIQEGFPKSSLWIDYAFRLIRYRKDTARARSALEKAKQMEIVQLALPHLPLCQGLIARQEKDYATARICLEEALRGFQERSQHKLIEGVTLLTKAYLCCVHGALGDTEQAKKLYAETKQFLIARKEDELLADCKNAVHET